MRNVRITGSDFTFWAIFKHFYNLIFNKNLLMDTIFCVSLRLLTLVLFLLFGYFEQSYCECWYVGMCCNSHFKFLGYILRGGHIWSFVHSIYKLALVQYFCCLKFTSEPWIFDNSGGINTLASLFFLIWGISVNARNPFCNKSEWRQPTKLSYNVSTSFFT